MPCHRSVAPSTDAASLIVHAAPRAEGHTGAPHGIPLVTLGAAAPGPDRLPLGDRVHHFQARSCDRRDRGAFFHAVTGLANEAKGLHSPAEQSPRLDLSNETFSGHREPSAWEQRLACAGILAALAIAITGGRPVAWFVLQLCEVLG